MTDLPAPPDPLSIPSPSQGVWHLGPFPIRAYALCIILGVVVAVWIGERRWVARGGKPGQVADIAIWAVPFGIVGGRLYHVITDNGNYFGEGKQPGHRALRLAGRARHLGRDRARGRRRLHRRATGRASSSRRSPTRWRPGIVVAQAIGRWGNYFNQELFGKPTTLPWGLEIPDVSKRPEGYQQFETFHPTFLYECIWDLGVAGPRDLGGPAGSGSGTAGRSRCTSRRTARAAAGSSTCASTPSRPTTSSGCGSTCGPRSCCSCLATAYFVVVGAAAPGPRGDRAPRQRRTARTSPRRPAVEKS